MNKNPALALLIVLGIAAGLVALAVPRAPSASAAGAALQLPDAVCGDGTASVTFKWTPVPGATVHWVDITIFDNGFAPDTFLGSSTGGDSGSLTWNGILTNVPHLWRVNALTAEGWVTSETGAFTPCGWPAVFGTGYSCQDRNLATMGFRWAPITPQPVVTYLDLGYDANFNPGTFYGNQMATTTWSFVWPNIPANLTQYYRVNSLGHDGVWRTSATGAVTAGCMPVQPGAEAPIGDRLIIPSAGVDAEVWSSKVPGSSGVMADPIGYFHATAYDFSDFAGLGGYANVGNLVLAGHVDCGTCHNGGSGTAVFWNVRHMQVGDTAQYITADGTVHNYVVVLSQDYSPDTDWSPIVNSGVADMTLITCVGNFSGGEYSLRHVVQLRKY